MPSSTSGSVISSEATNVPRKHLLRAFRGLTQSARVAGQVDDALQLMRTEHPLSPQSRHFVATSLESAMKAEQELHDARSAYAPWPYDGDYDPFMWGLR